MWEITELDFALPQGFTFWEDADGCELHYGDEMVARFGRRAYPEQIQNVAQEYLSKRAAQA